MCFVDESGHGKRAHNGVLVLELAYSVEFRSQNGFGSPVARAASPSALPALPPLPDSPPSSVDSHTPSPLPTEHVPSPQSPCPFRKRGPSPLSEVGRVLKNCTQVKVKVLLEIFTQKSKSNRLNSYLSKSKKVSDKKTKVVSY